MHTKKSKILKLFILIVLIVVLASNSKYLTSPFRARFTDNMSPLMNSTRAVSSSLKWIVPFAAVREENRLMREQINLLNRKLEEAKAVYAENERLKSMIDFRKTIAYSTVPAQVIGRDPSNWANSLIINKGFDNGVLNNKAVLYTRGLVGRTVELGRRSSKILLITDTNSKVGVLIQRNRQGGILVGRSDGTCKMVYIALDSDVAPGDKVVTAGLGSIFPKDIPVGEVVKVGKEPGRLYKYAVVRPTEDLSRLEEVLCTK